VIIGSGSGNNCHAYWPLAEPLTPPAAEAANLRLASALGADAACFDASRILRPPGTWNHKHSRPRPVVALRMDADHRFVAHDVLRHVPSIDPARLVRRWRTPEVRSSRDDPLLRIEPAVYVGELLSCSAGRNRKVTCPFHEDHRPSLHVFPTAERGWHCFSCGRGGSIYDLAAALWGMTPRGREFIDLRQGLMERFAGEIARQRLPRGRERT
jgi:hypothetical protein